PIPPASTTRRTRFDTLKASADIAGGVASMKDINVASQNLRVTGTGTANLASRAIDYRILVRLLKTPPGQGEDIGKLALADIPVNITGTMADPKVRPDLEGIARAALQKKIDEKKDELKQKLGNKLLDLLSR
ncbi:MAG: membrane assembly protein AsmA, partial [Proteobacteria bacterium]|nr:membrane assembly protein AsmA [Pseudomonadota bacterium]